MAVLNFADVSKNAEFRYTLVFKGIFLFQATRDTNQVYVMYYTGKGLVIQTEKSLALCCCCTIELVKVRRNPIFANV